MDMKTVDSPSRLHARRQIMKWLYRASDKDGKGLTLSTRCLTRLHPSIRTETAATRGYTR